jgi:hypothetical protein
MVVVRHPSAAVSGGMEVGGEGGGRKVTNEVGWALGRVLAYGGYGGC